MGSGATLALVRPLIESQLAVLLERDAQGRLVATRDPVARPAPRLFLGRSAEGNVWATRRDVDRETADALSRLCAAEPLLGIPSRECVPACRERALRLLGPMEAEYRGPCYVLPAEPARDGRAREIAPHEAAIWATAFPWLAAEYPAVRPVVIAFEQREPAAICCAPRGVTRQAAEAGVETLPPFRGRGLATAAVACWAAAVRRMGRIALYSTSWENAASQAVAGHLAGRLYGENWHVT